MVYKDIGEEMLQHAFEGNLSANIMISVTIKKKNKQTVDSRFGLQTEKNFVLAKVYGLADRAL